MEYVFYSAQPSSFLLTLAKLVEKVYDSGVRAVVVFNDRNLLEEFDNTLWTYSSNAFIPHGENDPEFQAVWLTTEVENKNDAKVVILVNNFCTKTLEHTNKVLFFFSQDQDKTALVTYEELKKNKKSVNYWNQSAKGWTNNFN